MAAEFDIEAYNKSIRELGSYQYIVYCEPQLLQEALDVRKRAVEELKKKYPNASGGALNFLVSHELDEFASDLLHPEYEKEALGLIAS